MVEKFVTDLRYLISETNADRQLPWVIEAVQQENVTIADEMVSAIPEQNFPRSVGIFPRSSMFPPIPSLSFQNLPMRLIVEQY